MKNINKKSSLLPIALSRLSATGMPLVNSGAFFMEQKEIWKDVIGYEGLYQVSNLGRVNGIQRTTRRKGETTRVVKPKMKVIRIDRLGYMRVHLCKDGKQKSFQVHRLIAMSFIDNPFNKKCVNHKNRIRTDNAPANLEWCTHRENTSHWRLLTKSTSKYTGVHWDKSQKKWVSSIRIQKKLITLGRFDYELEAHLAYENYKINILKIG